MRGGLLNSWSGLALVVALGACSNIIGLSDIEIDPSLGGGGANGGHTSGGHPAQGGTKTSPSGGDTVLPEAGESGVGGNSSAGVPSGGTDTGGTNTGGTNTGGTNTGGTTTGGTAALGGEAGMGGEPPTGCEKAADCDDTIDCTVDSCGPDHECVHTADSTVCTAATGMCSSCKLGIGCVDRAPTVRELLLDPNFDDATGDWSEYADNLDLNIFADPAAQTPGYSAKLGPAPAASSEQETADLYQQINIPPSTIKLTASGFYKMTPGPGASGRPVADDYTTLTLFSLEQPDGEFIRYIDYHTWSGSSAKQATWKAFTYDTPKAVLAKVLGEDVLFDFFTKTWDTVYYFDSVSLKASVCE